MGESSFGQSSQIQRSEANCREDVYFFSEMLASSMMALPCFVRGSGGYRKVREPGRENFPLTFVKNTLRGTE